MRNYVKFSFNTFKRRKELNIQSQGQVCNPKAFIGNHKVRILIFVIISFNRWKKCSDWIKDTLGETRIELYSKNFPKLVTDFGQIETFVHVSGLAVSYHYVKENFDDKSKEKVNIHKSKKRLTLVLF